jgi:hypothetical protein
VDPVKENPVPDARFEAELDSALRRAPDVHAPRNFRQRLMTQLPETPVTDRPRSWRLPVLAALVALLFGSLLALAVELGLARWLAQPSVLLPVLAIESIIALAWLWRTVFSR